MKTYITKSGQNIFDVCMTLYGSLEGLLDLLVANPNLSLDTTLSSGIELNYHEGINLNSDMLDYIEDNNLRIANGEHVMPFFSELKSQAKAIIAQQGKLSDMEITLFSGKMTIDWGDFSEGTIIDDTSPHLVEHAYKSATTHTITIYGDFECENLDITDVNGTMYPLATIKTSKFSSNSTSEVLKSLIEIV